MSKAEEAPSISLPEELILMLLNEETGYFHHVPGWELNCAVVGSALAELSLISRIDTDLNSLILINPMETGDPALDLILKGIVDGLSSSIMELAKQDDLDEILNTVSGKPVQKDAQYWVEKLSTHAEEIIDLTINKLVKRNIVKHHDGEFWTLSRKAKKGTINKLIKTRISEVIFTDTIPDPREMIIIALVNACDVMRFIFELDEKAIERIQAVSRMDLIGSAIANAVEHNITKPLVKSSTLQKKIPKVALHDLLLSPHLHTKNIPLLFADIAKKYGPVFKLSTPFSKPKIFLVGEKTNTWTHKMGRHHLSVTDYLHSLEKVYNASGVLPAIDGRDHFRLRRAMSPIYAKDGIEGQVDQLYFYARKFMSDWEVGKSYNATKMCRLMVNSQVSALSLGVDSQDIFDDIVTYKERALSVQVVNILPKFMLYTPAMKRKAKSIDVLVERVRSAYATTTRQSTGYQNLSETILKLHAADPQLMPEANLRFALSTGILAGLYLGDAFSFILYAMASQPKLQKKIQVEADALFKNKDPEPKDFVPSKIDITQRFVMESMRIYPVIPMSIRNVINSCIVEGYELPIGSKIYIAQTSSHFSEECFPSPLKFDIDRYLPSREEHKSFAYAPYGLGTHRCLGFQWVNMQLAVNTLIIAHHFTLKLDPPNYKLRFSPSPSMKPSKDLKFLIAEERHPLPQDL